LFVFISTEVDLMTQTPLAQLCAANDAINDPDELRRRLADTGYLFFRGLQNADRLRELRRDILIELMAGGWLMAGTDVDDGIANIDAQCTEGDPEYIGVYHQVQRLESFHRSGHWPEVLEMMVKVIGDGTVLPHPQKICRLWFPQYTEHTTPTHQDYVHFQGSFDTYTCWAPVGDCPIELGGLAVLPGSHLPREVKPHHFSLGAGLLAIDESDLSGAWHTTDYEAGDTLIFNSLLAHRALPNNTEDRMRVSLDNRYQSIHIPIAEQMLTPHLSGLAPLSWDEVYAGWDDEQLQYYWKAYDLDVMAKQMQWLDQLNAEVVERAAQGDAHAAHHLRRLIRREPDSELGQRASRTLRAAGLL
jgi:hypothetical protein